MEIQQDGKIIEVWLTHAEQDDPAILSQLRKFYAVSKQRGQFVAVYCSGPADLTQQTSSLLCYNRKRIAELEVQTEKSR